MIDSVVIVMTVVVVTADGGLKSVLTVTSKLNIYIHIAVLSQLLRTITSDSLALSNYTHKSAVILNRLLLITS